MTDSNLSTLTACREYLTRQGYRVTGRNLPEGREYVVTNFRGGLCFRGSRQGLINELAAGWLRYA